MKKIIKKKYSQCVIGIAVFWVFVQTAYAQGLTKPILTNPINVNSIPELLKFLIIDLLINRVAPIIVTIALIYSGFLFVQAQGNPEKLGKAKQALLWTLVGAVLLIGAAVIFGVVSDTVRQLGVGS